MEIDCEAFYIYFKLQFFAQTQKKKQQQTEIHIHLFLSF